MKAKSLVAYALAGAVALAPLAGCTSQTSGADVEEDAQTEQVEEAVDQDEEVVPLVEDGVNNVIELGNE